MAIALVSASKNTAATAGASVSISPAANTSAGNLLIVCWFANGTSLGFPTVTGSAGGTWSSSVIFTPDSNHTEAIYSLSNAAVYTTTDTVTVAVSGASEIDVHFLEYSGADTTDARDGSGLSNWYNGVPSTTGDPGSFTPTTANDLILGFSAQPNVNTAGVTPASGYTKELNNLVVGFECDTEDQVVSGTPTVDASWTYSVSAAWFCVEAAFKPPAAADTLLGQAVL